MCVEDTNKLKKGEFSLSSQLSTFLMTFNEINVSLCHISGKASNRDPIKCTNENFQVYKSLSVESPIPVKSLNTEDIISGNFKIPCTNHVSWKNVQKKNNDFCEVYSHLSFGSRPGKKEKTLKL